jgi:hypothetical protein
LRTGSAQCLSKSKKQPTAYSLIQNQKETNK